MVLINVKIFYANVFLLICTLINCLGDTSVPVVDSNQQAASFILELKNDVTKFSDAIKAVEVILASNIELWEAIAAQVKDLEAFYDAYLYYHVREKLILANELADELYEKILLNKDKIKKLIHKLNLILSKEKDQLDLWANLYDKLCVDMSSALGTEESCCR